MRYVGLVTPIQLSAIDTMGRGLENNGVNALLDRTLCCFAVILEDIRRTMAEEQEHISHIQKLRLTQHEFNVGTDVLLHASTYAPASKGKKFNFLLVWAIP